MRTIENASVVIVGVGGQGTLLTSRILGALAQEMGLNVKVSEVHGMSQRGGTVITYVRIGADVRSPLIEPAGADFILAFEQMEAARALPYLRKGGCVVANTQRIAPMSVVTGAARYPDDLEEKLRASAECVLLDAHALAVEAGESRAVNLVLLGALCAITGGDAALWERAVRACVPEKVLEKNLRAFALGARAVG